MAIESPLFQSSMELLGHSITHFNGTSELDRKLVILHLSNAVELLLKDMVLDSGHLSFLYHMHQFNTTQSAAVRTIRLMAR
jgi:hypothetical protein